MILLEDRIPQEDTNCSLAFKFHLTFDVCRVRKSIVYNKYFLSAQVLGLAEGTM